MGRESDYEYRGASATIRKLWIIGNLLPLCHSMGCPFHNKLSFKVQTLWALYIQGTALSRGSHEPGRLGRILWVV